MKYSEKLVWKAVYEFLPSIQKAAESGMPFNLPKLLEMAGLEVFLLIGTNGISSLGTNKSYAALIIQDALRELNTDGWMTFGEQNEYWS